MQLDLERSGLARQLLSLILLGERDVHLELLAGLMAGNLLLKARNELAGAQRQGKMLALAALESHAVHKALEVDIRDVAVLSLALTGNDAGVALTHALDLGLHSGVLDSIDFLCGF